jgi:uncharacterized phage protein (TIGR01671 family)
MESTKPTLNEAENGNKSKPLLSSRLLKFRAWVRDELMVNVVSIDFNNEFITWDDNQYDRCVPPNKCYEIESFCDIILMQFSGLKDKNEKDIYEGDIVTYKRSVGNWTGQTMTTTHKIIFTEEVNAFVMEYGSSYIKLRKHWCYEYEVIGNIFENPELL